MARDEQSVPLRAVAPGETAPVPARPMTVVEAAESGSRRDLLVAMKARVARAVGATDTSPRDLAALTKRLADLASEIDSLDAQDEQEQGVAGRGDSSARKPFDASAV